MPWYHAPVGLTSVTPGHGNQYKTLARSVMMHSAIEGVFRKPVKWHKLFQSLAPPAFDNFRISDIGETRLQMGSGKQAPPHDGRDIFDAGQMVDELLISNNHWQPLAEMISMSHQP